jgi:hypothetical protein
MMFEMPRYKVRYNDKAEWEEISEVEVLESMLKLFVKVSPAIQDMIQGKRVMTPDAIFRIKALRK